jgi:hypothetical protein
MGDGDDFEFLGFQSFDNLLIPDVVSSPLRQYELELTWAHFQPQP